MVHSLKIKRRKKEILPSNNKKLEEKHSPPPSPPTPIKTPSLHPPTYLPRSMCLTFTAHSPTFTPEKIPTIYSPLLTSKSSTPPRKLISPLPQSPRILLPPKQQGRHSLNTTVTRVRLQHPNIQKQGKKTHLITHKLTNIQHT